MTATQGDLRLGELAQIGISVKDLALQTRFYRDVLRIPLLFEVSGMSFFDCAGIRLMLAVPERAEFDHAASFLYFRVSDIRAAHAVLRERGVAFEGEPHLVAKLPGREIWMAFFRDAERNLHALTSEIPV